MSDLAMRSKAHWGYSAEFLEACRDELSVAPQEISAGNSEFLVAERHGEIVGFYVLSSLSAGRFELEALFVDPRFIGSGYGRALMDHAKGRAADRGGRVLVIESDPNAARFYRKVGGQPAGQRESSSIPGRFLPIFHLALGDRGG